MTCESLSSGRAGLTGRSGFGRIYTTLVVGTSLWPSMWERGGCHAPMHVGGGSFRLPFFFLRHWACGSRRVLQPRARSTHRVWGLTSYHPRCRAAARGGSEGVSTALSGSEIRQHLWVLVHRRRLRHLRRPRHYHCRCRHCRRRRCRRRRHHCPLHCHRRRPHPRSGCRPCSRLAHRPHRRRRLPRLRSRRSRHLCLCRHLRLGRALRCPRTRSPPSLPTPWPPSCRRRLRGLSRTPTTTQPSRGSAATPHTATVSKGMPSRNNPNLV